MATLAELQSELTAVNKAIQAVLVAGQGSEFAGRKLNRANLAELRAMKADLEQRISFLSTPQHGTVTFGGGR